MRYQNSPYILLHVLRNVMLVHVNLNCKVVWSTKTDKKHTSVLHYMPTTASLHRKITSANKVHSNLEPCRFTSSQNRLNNNSGNSYWESSNRGRFYSSLPVICPPNARKTQPLWNFIALWELLSCLINILPWAQNSGDVFLRPFLSPHKACLDIIIECSINKSKEMYLSEIDFTFLCKPIPSRVLIVHLPQLGLLT